ncbi:MutS-related protein [Capnocytophaga sputigena]|uniref:DNA mismatch repair protein n=1 Tax=Capnocytophaga sputigena TaxID=1019 RepID=A0AAX2IEC0_CAPSP|nr:DNA mismatch repair protein [Capnocytophaga sputigena]ATA83622.1 DNA mismatch repair protein [Capnocytophaga sputigena]EEB66211.1 MutS domain V protein [Capnocytophaga sputigena ATCC 33612]SQA76786.1 DNA mismatch repair protein mutS [Capnocytophaga sputigena]
MTNSYKEKLTEATTQYQKLNKQYNQMGLLRLADMLLIIALGYQVIKAPSILMGLFCALAIIVFFLLIVKHKKISARRTIAKTKIRINEQEIAFLEEYIFFTDNGSVFQQENHPYAYDLDILGERSLYHYLNRTHTFLGRKLLAERLLSPTPERILDTQKQIQALTPDLTWRQTFTAYAQQIDDSEEFYTKLSAWAKAPIKLLSNTMRYTLIALPILLVVCLLISYGWDNELLKTIGKLLLTVNLVTFFSFIGKIAKEKLGFERTYTMLYAFRECIAQVEARFPERNQQASTKIAQLSRLLDDLDSVGNILVSIPLNAFSFYHIHRYQQLLQWKARYAAHIEEWLQSVGEIEVLCSFANFSYNHPNFVYPTLNNKYKIAFEAIGHPLIPSEQCITNDIILNEQAFILLTGSNMSGKSTFLRTLGVNMLLTLVGLPVCARKANVHPLRLLVSMRLADSLSDGKSYFFAEINRIQQIVKTLESERCFVLLDEVLRGTNSEDKQQGTIKIVERLLSLQALGVLATHDIEVCNLSEQYPQQLQNKCFESIIENGELTFDYKLRDGVCKNKNATFLMKKLGII